MIDHKYIVVKSKLLSEDDKLLPVEISFWSISLGLCVIALGNYFVSLRVLLEVGIPSIMLFFLNIMLYPFISMGVHYSIIKYMLKRECKLKRSKFSFHVDVDDIYFKKHEVILLMFMPLAIIIVFFIMLIILFPLKYFWSFYSIIVLCSSSLPEYIFIAREIKRKSKKTYYSGINQRTEVYSCEIADELTNISTGKDKTEQ